MTSPIETQADDLVLRWQDLRRRHGGLGNGEFRAHHAGFADEVLDELLLRWQEERDAGGDPVERLCGSCPELADELRQRIAAIEAMEDRFGMEPTAPSESLPPTQPGTAADGNGTVHVPGFETLGELGHGGMGVVYKARQLKPSRLVALKMLLSGRYARPADRARFDSEVEALADLQHPNIVPIYQVGEVDGLPYFAMEYVEGGSLAQRLQGQPLPQREAAALVETLARAMHVAHTHGIIHRDLKPANVLLCHPSPQPPPRNGEGEQDPPPFPRREGGLGGLGDAIPKITDFGLAKRLNRERDLTPSHAIVGTVCYMAPEQAAGNIRAVGTPADIYAL